MQIKHHTLKESKILWFIAWVFIHASSVYAITLAISEVNIINETAILLLSGAGVALIASLLRSIFHKRPFVINKRFIFWSIVNAFGIWISWSIILQLHTGNKFIAFVIPGLMLQSLAKLINALMMPEGTRIIVVLVMFGLILYSTMDFGEIGKYLEPRCPQLEDNYFFIENGDPTMHHTSSLDQYYYARPALFGYSKGRTNAIGCRQGKGLGENPAYWYCGSQTPEYINYVEHKEAAQDGTILRISEFAYTNSYDDKGNFIKTTCGDDPDTIIEREYERQKKELNEFVGEIKNFAGMFS